MPLFYVCGCSGHAVLRLRRLCAVRVLDGRPGRAAEAVHAVLRRGRLGRLLAHPFAESAPSGAPACEKLGEVAALNGLPFEHYQEIAQN